MTFKPGSKGGKRSKSIRVTTNDPAHKNLTLKVSATVEVILAVSPDRINFRSLNKGAGSTAPLYAKLEGSEKAFVNITGVESKNELIKVETNQKGFEGDPEKQIKFSVLPGMNVGRFRERIRLKTDHPKLKSLPVFVYGEVIGNIKVTPRYLPFGVIAKGKKISKTIKLSASSDNVSFNVLEVKSSVPELSATLVTDKPGKEYHIDVALAQELSKSVLKGDITIKTDDKDQEIIKVRVFGRAAGASTKKRPMKPPVPFVNPSAKGAPKKAVPVAPAAKR